MVKPVNGGDKAPKGYGKITLQDDKNPKKKTTYYIPLGKKVHTGNKTYVISDKEVTIKGHKGQAYYDLIGTALSNFDINKDRKIDLKDIDRNYTLPNKIQRDKNKPRHFDIMNISDISELYAPDCYFDKGVGGVSFINNSHDDIYQIRIED